VEWVVEFTDEFKRWWDTLSEAEQGKVDARVGLLMDRGPSLGFPFSSDIKTSRFPEMRELRVQAGGDPLRILYAFDARRVAILLVAATKPVMTVGMKSTFQSPTGCSSGTCTISRRRDRAMARNFKELRAKMSAGAKAASEEEHRRLVDEMSLHQLRKARAMTQTAIAEELHIGQGDVSKLERRTDMYVSTLAGYLQAVGAELEIRAVFPEGRVVKITQFSEEAA
jgi:predicted XRE-type DNA-binding protein